MHEFISHLLYLGENTKAYPIINPGRWIFNQCPKTASRAMHTALKKYGIETLHGPAALPWLRSFDEDLGAYKTFSFCRNPFDRAVSLAHHFGIEWDDFIKELPTGFRRPVSMDKNMNLTNWPNIAMHCQPQNYYTHIDGKQAVEFIGRYENINTDWQKLLIYLGLKYNNLEWRDEWKTDHKPWPAYYKNGRARDAVLKFYEDDFQLLEYDTNILQ